MNKVLFWFEVKVLVFYFVLQQITLGIVVFNISLNIRDDKLNIV